MKFTELENKRARVAARTITAKDENGKTRGIVHAVNFYNLPPRVQFEVAGTLRKAGTPRGIIEKYLYIDDAGKPFIIHDLRRVENFKKYFENDPVTFAQDHKTHAAIEAATAAAGEFVPVVNCYLI